MKCVKNNTEVLNSNHCGTRILVQKIANAACHFMKMQDSVSRGTSICVTCCTIEIEVWWFYTRIFTYFSAARALSVAGFITSLIIWLNSYSYCRQRVWRRRSLQLA